MHRVFVSIDDITLPGILYCLWCSDKSVLECPIECRVNDMTSVRAHGDALYKAQRDKISRFEVSIAKNGAGTGGVVPRGELDVVICGILIRFLCKFYKNFSNLITIIDLSFVLSMLSL